VDRYMSVRFSILTMDGYCTLRTSASIFATSRVCSISLSGISNSMALDFLLACWRAAGGMAARSSENFLAISFLLHVEDVTSKEYFFKATSLLALDTTLKRKPFTSGANDLSVRAEQPSDGMACYAVTSTYSTWLTPTGTGKPSARKPSR